MNIKSWSDQDKPREKFKFLGVQSLSDAELLAILLRSGTKGQSALSLAKEILNVANQNLYNLGKLDLKSLIEIKGVGEAKAISIIAAMELGRRRQVASVESKIQIRSSRDAYNCIGPSLADLEVEEFWILLLDRNNQLLKKVKISSGGVSGTVVDLKVIFKHAIEKLSSSIILFHNHPSGNLQPSVADKKLTDKIYKAAQNLDMKILDHLIVGANGYFSFADEGLI